MTQFITAYEIMSDPVLSEHYDAVFLLGDRFPKINSGHRVCPDISIQDSNDMLHLMYGADISRIAGHPMRIQLTKREGTPESLPGYMETALRSPSGKVNKGYLSDVFTDLAVFDREMRKEARFGAVRTNLTKLLLNPNGLEYLHITNRSQTGALAFSSAMNADRNNLKLSVSGAGPGQKPILEGPPPSPVSFRIDNQLPRVTVDIANANSGFDMFFRTTFAAALKDSLHVEMNHSVQRIYSEMENNLDAHKDAFVGAQMEGIENSVCEAYQFALLASNHALDNGISFTIGNNNHRDLALKKDVIAFGQGEYRNNSPKLAVRAFNYLVNDAEFNAENATRKERAPGPTQALQPKPTREMSLARLREEAKGHLYSWAAGTDALKQHAGEIDAYDLNSFSKLLEERQKRIQDGAEIAAHGMGQPGSGRGRGRGPTNKNTPSRG
jgi:curved DNA-binding protein CbpA